MSFICLFYIRNNIIISSSSFVSNKQNIQSFSTYSELTLIRIRLIKSTFYRNMISIDAKKRKRKKIDKWLFVTVRSYSDKMWITIRFWYAWNFLCLLNQFLTTFRLWLIGIEMQRSAPTRNKIIIRTNKCSLWCLSFILIAKL